MFNGWSMAGGLVDGWGLGGYGSLVFGYWLGNLRCLGLWMIADC